MFPCALFLKFGFKNSLLFLKFISFLWERCLTINLDRAGTSRDINVSDRDFSRRVDMMLNDNFTSEESDVDDPVDDSDIDPDYILPNETNHQADDLSEQSQSESENEDEDLEGKSVDENVQVENCLLPLSFW